MKLFLLRHGQAGSHGSFSKDSERPLTEEGIEELKEVAGGMKAMGWEFDLVLSSPYVRARQTAEIVVKKLGLEKFLQFRDSLVPEARHEVLIDEIQKMKNPPESLLLVGHEPYMSKMISLLTTGDYNACISMKKAGLCKLEMDVLRNGRCAFLEWLLTPKQLTRLAEA